MGTKIMIGETGFLVLLTIVFVVLRLCKVIAWPWLLVLYPIWILVFLWGWVVVMLIAFALRAEDE